MSRTKAQTAPPDIYWSKGDTAPAISEVLRDGTGAVVDLSGASVRFQALFFDAGSSAQAIDQAASIVGPGANGTVSYTPTSADTDTVGDLLVQWKVTFAGGAIERFPNWGYQKVRVQTSTA